jgi:hypothetical protein
VDVDSGWTEVEVADVPWRVAVRTAVIEGRTRLIGLHLEPSDDAEPQHLMAISSEALRTFPVRAVLRAAQDARGERGEPEWTELVRRRGKTHDPRHYEFVASAYDMAMEEGESPSAFIGGLWEVSRSTANVWIREARVRGLLDRSEVAPNATSRRSGGRRRG